MRIRRRRDKDPAASTGRFDVGRASIKPQLTPDVGEVVGGVVCGPLLAVFHILEQHVDGCPTCRGLDRRSGRFARQRRQRLVGPGGVVALLQLEEHRLDFGRRRFCLVALVSGDLGRPWVGVLTDAMRDRFAARRLEALA